MAIIDNIMYYLRYLDMKLIKKIFYNIMLRREQSLAYQVASYGKHLINIKNGNDTEQTGVYSDMNYWQKKLNSLDKKA